MRGSVARQAFAGLLWSKQYYHYVVKHWLDGDPAQPPPPPAREHGRNREWTHLYNADVISMPDKWEYPWYAAWDLAFHCVPLALVDSDFAKEQLDAAAARVVHAPERPAARLRVGVRRRQSAGARLGGVARLQDRAEAHAARATSQFLERVFHKLLLNFTWWVNRKDAEGMNVFQGGFLGLDNIGVFDRSAPLPTGGHLEQSDGTSWMAMYSLNMLAIAMELAKHDPAYEDVASKFWEHFLNIAHAMSGGRLHGGEGHDLWNEEDGFFYDVLHLPDDTRHAAEDPVARRPDSAARGRRRSSRRRSTGTTGSAAASSGSSSNRPDLTDNVACMQTPGHGERRLLSILDGDRLRRILHVMLDEREFLSPYGIRAISQRPPRAARTCCTSTARTTASTTSPANRRTRPVRRQLELARTDLVSDQLPARRGAAEVPSLLRRRLQGGVPDRIGPDDDAVGSGRGALAPPDARSSSTTRAAAARCSAASRAIPAAIRTGTT